MALSDLSFKFYTDSSLSTEFSGTYQLTHASDLTDDSAEQDFVLYFGSTIPDRKLQANSNPGTDQVTITPTDILVEWAADTAYSVGDRVQPTTANGKVYECTTAGTSDSTEPTWPTSGVGSTVVDKSVVWTLKGNKHEETEIKLASTSAGLDGATGGAGLDLGATINSLSANAKEVHIRITNAVSTVGDNIGHPAIGLNINEVIEKEA